MINILIGRPGAGKSYEAVAFHVIPAIKAGRQVITNLPLNVDYFCSVFGDHVRDLIIIYLPNKDNKIRFQHPFDYKSEWKHPVSGIGPLFIIDECHFPLRRGGTFQQTEEWFSMHRHENADVLLITQSYGKVDKNICAMVQLMYRCTKKTAWGDESSYIRKVFDGIGGAEMNVETRSYDKAFFPFYRSHTKSDSSSEAYAADVKPFWKQWPVLGAAACLLIAPLGMVYMSMSGNGLMTSNIEPVKTSTQTSNFQDLESRFSSIESPAIHDPATPVPAKPVKETIPDDLPYGGFKIAVVGQYNISGTVQYLFQALQNGQPTFDIFQTDIELAGYTVEALNDCAAILSYDDLKWPVTCQFPKIQVVSN